MKIRFWVLVTILFVPLQVKAQIQSANTFQIHVAATIKAQLDIITVKNLEFGKVSPNQIEVRVSPITDSNAGQIKVTGQPGAEISVSFISETRLNNSQSDNFLTFYYQVSQNDEDLQANSEMLELQNEVGTLNADGEYYFWIGGYCDISNLVPGDYQGDFNLEIEYN